MIINTANGQIDTDKPCKCRKCRRMFVGKDKPGKTSIAQGQLKFVCWQCVPPEPESKP